MSGHLPECCVGENDCSATACQRCHACCICEQLRACEERVLDAAREAVQSQRTDDPMWAGTNWNNALFCAEEAIEALRGER